jgi:hypothetical protein
LVLEMKNWGRNVGGRGRMGAVAECGEGTLGIAACGQALIAIGSRPALTPHNITCSALSRLHDEWVRKPGFESVSTLGKKFRVAIGGISPKIQAAN